MTLLPCCYAAAQAPPGWSPELGDAFERYYAGRFGEVANVCRSVAESTRRNTVKHDAEALSAMALLRQPVRSERIDGRTRLGQVAQRNAALIERPDCRFALGVARSALGESALSLGDLLLALDGFERERRTPRMLEACVAIADTWSRFGEWSTPIPGLPLAVPDSVEAASRERAKRVASIRVKAAALPDSAEALRRIDFFAARMGLSRADSRGAALDSLRAIASVNPLDEFAADVALQLAEELTVDQRGADAAAIYRRVAQAGLGERSKRAEALAAEASRPRLELAVVGTPRPGKTLQIEAKASRLRSIEIEVRRIDLAAHLTERQGTLLEQNLPDDGATIGTQSLRPLADAGEVWSARADFAAPAGAFVALASAIDASGAPLRSRLVCVVSDLDAAVVAGPRQLLVMSSGSGVSQARFWMQGSFVPVELEFSGCTLAPLPPEARLLRDRRWVCLIQSDAGLALCRGTLPGASDLEAPIRSIVSVGPERPRVGEEIEISGVLLSESGAIDRDILRRGVEIELSDTMDDVRARVSTRVDASGLFSVRIRIPPDLAGSIVHPVIRGGGRVYAPLYRPVTVHVASGDARTADLEMNLGLAGSANEGLVRADLRGFTACGRPLANKAAYYRVRAVRLPDGDDDPVRLGSAPYVSNARLDAGGRTSLSHPMAMFKFPPGPIALNAEASVETPDERGASVQRELLSAARPAHVWIEWDDAADPIAAPAGPRLRIGESLTLRVGWFDPRSLAAGAFPRLEIRAPGGEFVEYPLQPDRGGLLGTEWSPWRAGVHELRASLPQQRGEAITAVRKIEVGPGGSHDADITAFEASLVAERTDELSLRVLAGSDRPLLVAVVGQDPLGAAWLPIRVGERTATIPIARMPATGAVATLLELSDGVVRRLGCTPVAAPALALRVAGGPSTRAAGNFESLAIERADGGSLEGASLLARLSTADDTGAVDWLLRATAGMQRASQSLPIAASGASEPQSIPAAAAFPGGPGLLLTRGSTLWSGVSRSPSGPAKLRIPLPESPGPARVRGAAFWPDGRVAVLDELLRVQGPVTMQADLPETFVRGDQLVAALRLGSTGRPVEGVLRAVGARGLTLGEWSVGAGRAEVTPTPGEPAAALQVPAAGMTYLRLPIEAPAAGRGSLRFEFAADNATIATEAPYRVLDTPADPASRPASDAPAPIRVQRTLYVVTPVEAHAQAEIEGGPNERPSHVLSLANQPRVEIRDATPLPIGTVVLVEETIESTLPLTDVSWTQYAPGNCVTTASDSRRDFRALSADCTVRSGQYTYSVPRLAAGRTVHHYLLIVSRPGSCNLAVPAVRVAGSTLQADFVGKAARITSAD